MHDPINKDKEGGRGGGKPLVSIDRGQPKNEKKNPDPPSVDLNTSNSHKDPFVNFGSEHCLTLKDFLKLILDPPVS